VPKIRFHLADLRLLEGRLSEEGSGKSWEQVTAGLRYGASDRLLVAIAREIDEQSDWNNVWTPPGLLAGLVAGREYARRREAERQVKRAEREAAFDEALAAFERGEGPDPRVVRFRIPVGG
jgi:hypothetical protein